MDPNDITNITVAQPEHCMLVSWELVDRFIYLLQDQKYISSAFSQVFNYTRWKKAEKICLTSLCWSSHVKWKESVVTTRKEQLGMMETQPSTANASSKAGEGNVSCFQKPLLRQFLLVRRRQESIFPLLTTCVEDISRTIGFLMLPVLSHQTVCDHYPRSWQQGQGSGCLWTLSQMALQGLCYISQSK